MSEIFYSQIDDNLRRELDARAQAGKSDRSTKALDFMLGKIANVQLDAWEEQVVGAVDVEIRNEDGSSSPAGGNPGIKTKKLIASLGGNNVRSGEYLPSGPQGFLNTVDIVINDNSIAQGGDMSIIGAQSNRTPPYITSAEVSIGDHSMGLLNRATINIVIPDIERDLEFFESVWMRPGRNVTITIAHPEEAVITRDLGNNLTDNTFPSYEEIKKRIPYITEDEYSQSKKLNSYKFNGLVTSYNLDYQEDASVQVTLQLTGTSNSYTDITFLQDTNNIPQQENINLTSAQGEPVIGDISADTIENVTNLEAAIAPDSLFDNLEATTDAVYIQQQLRDDPDYTLTTFIGSGRGTPIAEADENNKFIFTNIRETSWAYSYGHVADAATNDSEWYKYISLGLLINYMNSVVISKNPNSIEILFGRSSAFDFDLADANWSRSTYYKYICSANPHNIWIFDPEETMNRYGEGEFQVWKQRSAKRLIPFSAAFYDGSEWFEGGGDYCNPERIFVNLEVVKKLIDRQKNETNTFSITQFLDDISREVHLQLGGAVDLKLITHPFNDNLLLWYDSNFILSERSNSVVPYDFPMFANDPRGSIVRSFNFSAKIPDNLKNLAYVLNQNTENISESDIAPYMNFMFNSLNVQRERDPITGDITINRNVGALEKIQQLNEQYREKHEKYLNQLKSAKLEFISDYKNSEKISKLQAALRHYIQYPTPDIKDSNTLTAPILPFDVSVEIDGINGFRYGDVLQFKGLPERYRVNTVFSIISITHTIGTDGQWTTKLQCIMRPKITDNNA